jgi:hypothetical protein
LNSFQVLTVLSCYVIQTLYFPGPGGTWTFRNLSVVI